MLWLPFFFLSLSLPPPPLTDYITHIAGTLNVSNMICVIFSRLALGLSGASVRRTGCSSGATRSSL